MFLCSLPGPIFFAFGITPVPVKKESLDRMNRKEAGLGLFVVLLATELRDFGQD